MKKYKKNKKYFKKNKYLYNRVKECKNELAEHRLTKYRGFFIKKCTRTNFDTEYYTIINPKTGGHVHSTYVDCCFNICDIARCITNNTYSLKCLSRQYSMDIIRRASNLSYKPKIDNSLTKKGGISTDENHV